MPERGKNSRFSLGSALHVLTGREDLDSNAAVQQFVVCTINVCHPAATQQGNHSVPTRNEPASARSVDCGRAIGPMGVRVRSLVRWQPTLVDGRCLHHCSVHALTRLVGIVHSCQRH
jgi:hypothetical protein